MFMYVLWLEDASALKSARSRTQFGFFIHQSLMQQRLWSVWAWSHLPDIVSLVARVFRAATSILFGPVSVGVLISIKKFLDIYFFLFVTDYSSSVRGVITHTVYAECGQTLCPSMPQDTEWKREIQSMPRVLLYYDIKSGQASKVANVSDCASIHFHMWKHRSMHLYLMLQIFFLSRNNIAWKLWSNYECILNQISKLHIPLQMCAFLSSFSSLCHHVCHIASMKMLCNSHKQVLTRGKKFSLFFLGVLISLRCSSDADARVVIWLSQSFSGILSLLHEFSYWFLALELQMTDNKQNIQCLTFPRLSNVPRHYCKMNQTGTH